MTKKELKLRTIKTYNFAREVAIIFKINYLKIKQNEKYRF